jgi:putative transcriptional regulator
MIRFRLAELMADHQFKHGRRITVKDLSEATGINRNTLSRMANTRGYSTSTDTLDKLCRYFGCDVGDLARYVDDAPAEPMPSAAKEPAKNQADGDEARRAGGALTMPLTTKVRRKGRAAG